MIALNETPEKGGNNYLYREVQAITGHPPTDVILADMGLTKDRPEREALGRRAAASLGKGTAEHFPRGVFLPNHAIAIMAKRAGHPAHGEYADELQDIYYFDAWPKRRDELSDQAMAHARESIDLVLSLGPRNEDALDQHLHDLVEDDLGRFSDANLAEAVPALVKHAGFSEQAAKKLIVDLLVVGEQGREARNAERRRAHDAAVIEYRCNLNIRKRTNRPRFDTYLINPATGRAVADEEFEAAEIARADREAFEAARKSALGNIELLAGQGASVPQLALEAFIVGLRSRNCTIDVEAVVSELATACRSLDREIVAKAFEAGRVCAGGTEAEHAFTRFLTSEGLAGVNVETPAATAITEPMHAFVADEGAQASALAPPAPRAALGDERAHLKAVGSAIKRARYEDNYDLLALVRRAALDKTLPEDALASAAIEASGETTTFMRDAIRFSIEEARASRGAPYDDQAVEARVDERLNKKHAPLSGNPGIIEARARDALTAMTPTGSRGPTPFVWCDPHSLPRRAWLYGTHLIRKELSATISPGGGGKTALTIVEALALATGRALLGIKPAQRCRVWIWNGEEPLEELRRRILAACVRYGIEGEDLAGWLFVDNFESFDFVIAEQTRDGTTIAQPKVDLLVRWLKENEIDVLFIDPAISTHNVGENDNVAVQKWATAWKSVAVGANVAISMAHHAKKLGGQNATADDSRGARSFVDKCRVVRSLNPMSKDDARAFGVPEEERRFHFWSDPTEGKANMSAAVGGKEWFKSASVILGKGRHGKLDEGESVGVVERWKPPSFDDALDKGRIEALCVAMGARSWRAAPNGFGGPDSVGRPIAIAFDLDPATKAGRDKAKAIYGKLKARGIVIEEKVTDDDYKLRPVARLADDWKSASPPVG